MWRATFSYVTRLVFQAQARMQESAQKVDLLRHSLEHRFSELPQDHPTHAAVKEELVMGTVPSNGTPKKQSSGPSSSSFFKPASLTGCLFKITEHFQYFLISFNFGLSIYDLIFFFSGRLEVCLMGCQDLLETVPGRGRVTSVSTTPGSTSEGKSLKIRAGLSGRSTNGKTMKADDLSCKTTLQPNSVLIAHLSVLLKNSCIATKE